MNRFLISIATVAAASTVTTASAQFAASTPKPAKSSVSSATTATTGGFLTGADDCNSAHRNAGSGDQIGVPFINGTTGAEGQNEANCYAFGTSGVDNDVWFDWSSTVTGTATYTTCNGTATDTKIAVYPGAAGCPADGTSIACNDDACGLQSSVAWPVTVGASYTLQLGTFPGAGGGSGTFDVTQDGSAPPPCGTYDDGVTENALGLTAGGETGWLHNQECLQIIDDVQTAYGMPGGTNPADGVVSRIGVYEDADCDRDPATGPLALLWSTATVTTNVGTDILNSNPTGGVFVGSRCSWVMATAEQPAGTFPAPMDQTNPTPKAWITGSTPSGATLDMNDPNASSTGALPTDAIGFPTAWLLRAVGSETPEGYPTQCFGNGCPCGNDDPNGGCANSTGSGSSISGSGLASVSNDTFHLSVTGTANNFGLFFQGSTRLDPGIPFGDGFLCCAGQIVRIGTYLASGNATDTATGNLVGGFGPPISALPGNQIQPGQTLCYQWWHRDSGGPCQSKFNLSNAVKATWTP